MALIDWGRKIANEGNAGVPAGLNVGKCYDLHLFGELGNPQGVVLWVVVVCHFKFKEKGEKNWADAVAWTAGQQDSFKNDFKALCESTWSDQFKIRTSNASGNSPTTASVVITVRTDGTYWGSHYSIDVYNVSQSKERSFVDGNNGSEFESVGLIERISSHGTKERRALVHEFGHFLGLRDEYLAGGKKFTPTYQSDDDSIMHSWKLVRPRHYVFFADWLTKCNKLTGTWAVDGNPPRTLQNTPM